MKLKLVGDVDDADHGQGPAESEHVQPLLHGCRSTDGFERVVDATRGDRLDRGDRIVASRVDDVGRAATSGEVELGVVDVDGDDLLRVRKAGSLDGGQADPSATDHRDGRAGRNLRGVEDRTHTGQDAAAEEAGAGERECGVDLHHVVLAHEHVLGEATQCHELVNGAAHVVQARGCVGSPGVVIGEAPVRLPGHAVRTVPAEHGQARDDVVTGPQVADTGADRLDDPGRFVPEDERHGEGHSVAAQGVDVAVAHTGCNHADVDLADSRLVDVDVDDLRCSRHRVDDRGAHQSNP